MAPQGLPAPGKQVTRREYDHVLAIERVGRDLSQLILTIGECIVGDQITEAERIGTHERHLPITLNSITPYGVTPSGITKNSGSDDDPLAGRQLDASGHHDGCTNEESRCFQRLSSGARRDRTDDLLAASEALSQLSYSPMERRQV